MQRLALSALIAALMSSSHAAPDHAAPARLTGTYSIGAASLTDPAPGEAKDALLRLHLTGNSARDLFNAIPSSSKRDACFDDGTMVKASGALRCARHPRGSHECWIGIDLKRPALAPGFVC